MTKQQQEEKKLRDAQFQQAKQQFQQRENILMQKEFAVREWEAEIKLMKLPMEHASVLEAFNSWKKEQEAKRALEQPILDETSEIKEDADTKEQEG